ncbi:DUF4412 domain-containing protein [Chitinophaga sedimenti]|uniref:DUF4412 domain-containing protein n=1 Tax=Chitinophaga sedimenti TaxID=2033606 RepID=UPI002003CA24|nr:DUF4412 domain-containing protein [Chitinophaga sedimenti]MCK7557892.1 DUF4412 domain-containing protein [Chitinophaga sedimenti]
MEVPGAELPMKLYQINNKAMRLQFEYNGEENIQFVTSDFGWMLMPVQQMSSPVDLPADQHKLAKRGLALGGELVNYKELNKKLELVGKETTGGQQTYKLKLTDAEGLSTTMLIDATTYYMVHSEADLKVSGQSVTIKTSMSDFKKTPEGYVFPYSMVQESVGPPITFKLTKIEVNKPIDEALFKKPS